MRMLTIALLWGCGIDPFETPSAYDQQQYLCDDLDALQEAAITCRDEPPDGAEPCQGYISFQGTIQLVNLRVDTTLERGRVVLAEEPDTAQDTDSDGQLFLSRVEMSGAAPYFHFDVAISSIGTPWDEQHGHWPLTFGSPDPETAFVFDDGVGAVQWYIRAGSDSALLSSNDGSGTITVDDLADDRVDLRFVGGLGPSVDKLDACAVVFPPSLEIVPIP